MGPRHNRLDLRALLIQVDDVKAIHHTTNGSDETRIGEKSLASQACEFKGKPLLRVEGVDKEDDRRQASRRLTTKLSRLCEHESQST